jgi:hypothetical protein
MVTKTINYYKNNDMYNGIIYWICCFSNVSCCFSNKTNIEYKHYVQHANL